MRTHLDTDALTRAGSLAAYVADAQNRLNTAVRRTVAMAAVALLLLPGRVAAQSSEQSGGSCPSDVPEQFQAIADLLTRIQQLGVALGLSIAVVMYVWAGILWMRGTPDSQQRARRIFFNTSVGLVLILMAGGLVEFVKSVLCGGTG